MSEEIVAQASVVRSFGGPESVELVEVPVPGPGPGQVRVAVRAAAVNPIDLSTRSGALAAAGLVPERPLTALGWDLAGVVEATGPGVRGFAEGDAVIGLRDLISAVPGSHATHVVVDQSALAPAPRGIGWAEAASLPLNALSADRALDASGAGRGDTLLVTGAAGAVGGFALELGALRGIHTIAVAGPADEETVRDLGAGGFLPRADLLAGPVRELCPGGVNAVIDAACIGIAAHEALRGGGTFVALVRPFAPPPVRGTEVVVQEVFADGARLARLGALAAAGLLRPRVAAELPLAEAARAHELLAAGGARGRFVLRP